MRLDAPAFHRNHAAILAVLTRYLGALAAGDVLEVGSGTGQHAVAFAAALPALTWWPTDVEPAHLRSIDDWRRHAGSANLRAPMALDVATADWGLGAGNAPPGQVAAIVAINVAHIAPWPVTEGLLAGAGRCLAPGGHLFIYGPFARDGAHVSESNAEFDRMLRSENPQWGVRDIAEVRSAAVGAGLALLEAAPMPANNFTLALERMAPQ